MAPLSVVLDRSWLRACMAAQLVTARALAARATADGRRVSRNTIQSALAGRPIWTSSAEVLLQLLGHTVDSVPAGVIRPVTRGRVAA